MIRDSTELKFAALRIEQRRDVPLFVFGVNGRVVQQFATVDQADRSGEGVLVGYQRPRVTAHIAQIQAYLAQDDAMLPNAIVVAFSEGVRFVPTEGVVRSSWGTPGLLTIFVAHGADAVKPGLIVDGQQRVTALSQLPASRNFPVVVVAFATTSAQLQREQFVLVNKTKPLPRDLLNELLPHIETQLPQAMSLRRVSARVVELLRFDTKSPFYGRMRGVGQTGEGGSISQAAVIAVIERSVRRGGVLAQYYDRATGEGNPDAMARVVAAFYTAVARVWPDAWLGNPWSSRLVHGVGINAVGALMDEIALEVNPYSNRIVSLFERRLRRIKTRCAWTAGRWPVLKRGWDELQNTSQDKRVLSAYLVAEYRRRRG